MNKRVEPIMRFKTTGKNQGLTVLCPIGHLIEHFYFDRTFGGSWLEAEIGAHQAGYETRWHREAAKCDGAGHIHA